MGLSAGQIALDADFSTPTGKMIAYGSRNTDSLTTTTEQGVLRLDGVPVIAGRRYWTAFSFASFDTVTGDFFAGRLRYSTSGVATTSSTLFGVSPAVKADNFTTNQNSISGSILAAATGTISILFAITRVTGSGTVKTSGFLEMPIFDGGPSPSTTVVVL